MTLAPSKALMLKAHCPRCGEMHKRPGCEELVGQGITWVCEKCGQPADGIAQAIPPGTAADWSLACRRCRVGNRTDAATPVGATVTFTCFKCGHQNQGVVVRKMPSGDLHWQDELEGDASVGPADPTPDE